MKLEEIKFIPKSCRYNANNNGITFTKDSQNRVTINFYNQQTMIGDNNYCSVGYVENRVYFMMSKTKNTSYKFVESHRGYKNAVKIVVQGKKATPLLDFVRVEYYTPNFDSECNLWYIER